MDVKEEEIRKKARRKRGYSMHDIFTFSDSKLANLFRVQDIELFRQRYVKERMIGEGATGKVYLGKVREITSTLSQSSPSIDFPKTPTKGVVSSPHSAAASSSSTSTTQPPVVQAGQMVAIKEIHEKTLIRNSEIIQEVSILMSLNHQNIIKLVDVFLTIDRLFIVMELASGPELFDAICECRNYSEHDAVMIVRQLCDALYYLHKNGVAHRDIKPENILYASDSPTAPIKLVDFGLSTSAGALDLNTTGTLGYKAPELFKSAKNPDPLPVDGKGCDMWALGVITYILLCGFPPFFSSDDYRDPDFQMNAPFWVFFNEETPRLVEQICEGEIEFPGTWDSVSSEAKDFITKLLEKDPTKRMESKDALLHPWIAGPTNKKALLSSAKSSLSNFVRLRERLTSSLQKIYESPPASPSPATNRRTSFGLSLPDRSSGSANISPLPSPRASPRPSVVTPRGRRKSAVLGRVPTGMEFAVSPRIQESLVQLDQSLVKDQLARKIRTRPNPDDPVVRKFVKKRVGKRRMSSGNDSIIVKKKISELNERKTGGEEDHPRLRSPVEENPMMIRCLNCNLQMNIECVAEHSRTCESMQGSVPGQKGGQFPKKSPKIHRKRKLDMNKDKRSSGEKETTSPLSLSLEIELPNDVK